METFWVVALKPGDYLQLRGGWDWGRVSHVANATKFESRDEAEMWAKHLAPFRAMVEEEP